MATGLMVIGIMTALRGNVVSGVWIALIGWFLENAAKQTLAQASLSETLRGVSVEQTMSRDCPRVGGDVRLERLVRDEVLGAGRRCFFVTDDGRLRGMLTLGDIKAVPRERWCQTAVEDVMTSADKLRVIRPEDDLLAALRSMEETDVAQLPVISDGRLVGAVGREQILRYLGARAELGM